LQTRDLAQSFERDRLQQRLTERQERRKQNLQTRIMAVLERAGLVLNHFESDPRGYALYLDLPDGSYNSFGGRECGYGIGR
jgi:hypothetical protein